MDAEVFAVPEVERFEVGQGAEYIEALVIDEAQLRIENRIEFAVNAAGEIAIVAAFDVATTHDAADLIGLFEGLFDMLGEGEGDRAEVFLRPGGGLLLRFVGDKVITEGNDDDGDCREQAFEVGGVLDAFEGARPRSAGVHGC